MVGIWIGGKNWENVFQGRKLADIKTNAAESSFLVTVLMVYILFSYNSENKQLMLSIYSVPGTVLEAFSIYF